MLAALAGACGPAGEPPSQEAGPLPRVVSFAPELSAIVVELGLPVEDAGDACDVGPEYVAALAPDATLLLGDACGIALADALHRRGVPASVVAPRDMNEVTEAYHRLGTMLGRELRANLALARVIREIGQIAVARDGRTRLRVAWLLERNPLVAVGGEGMLHELLELAGAENAFHEPGAARISTTAGEIAARAPDRVLDSSGGEATAAAVPVAERIPAALAAFPVLDVLPRVRALHERLYPDQNTP